MNIFQLQQHVGFQVDAEGRSFWQASQDLTLLSKGSDPTVGTVDGADEREYQRHEDAGDFGVLLKVLRVHVSEAMG